MTRLTEQELAAKSARNRKAKAETWPDKLLIDSANELRKMLGGKSLDGDVAQAIVNDVRNPPKKPGLVAHVSKTGKVGKFKPIIPTEHQEQCRVIEWCDQHPVAKHIFAIPNGANKSPATAAKFKREGLRKGVPDLFLPVARSSYHGLFIEMKRTKGGRSSLEQSDWCHNLRVFGFEVLVCHGADKAIAMIQSYLNET